MKYLCLVYLSPEHWSSAPDEACFACSQEMAASGHFITGTPLHPVHTATTRARAQWSRHRDRWPVRRDQGSAGRFLPD